MTDYRFATSCTSVPRRDVEELNNMRFGSSDREITRRTFLAHVDRNEMRELETALGYAHPNSRVDLTMAADWAVSYHRSKAFGRRVYYFCWSSIEHVFTPDGSFRPWTP
jgi:hypothetical protein